MAEYYAVLKKAIGGLESNQAEARRTVYGKARIALIGRLRAADPPLNTAEISRRRLELEEDIRKVERESVANPSRAHMPARPVAPLPAPQLVPMAPVPTPASELVEESSPSPEDVFRRAIQEAMNCGSRAGAAAGVVVGDTVPTRAEANQLGQATADLDLGPPDDHAADLASPPLSNPVRVTPVPTPMSEAAEEGSPSPEDIFRCAVEEATIYGSAPAVSGRAIEHTAIPTRAEVNRHGGATADLRPLGEGVIDHAPLPMPARERERAPPDDRDIEAAVTDRRDRPNLPLRREPTFVEEYDHEALERKARPSRLPSLLRIVLIAAVMLGGGALAWSKRDAIGHFITALDRSNEAAP